MVTLVMERNGLLLVVAKEVNLRINIKDGAGKSTADKDDNGSL
jgi:hypothetical protein